jgi:lipopolysaccharide assembly outer membrane protein LptD (OstA)
MISNFSFGQRNTLKLLPGTDVLEYDKRTGISKLIGNVNFVYQENTMYCDSAFYSEKSRTVRAYGRVHINKRDTLNLFCDSLFYDGRTRKAKLWGNVRVRDREYKLTTDTLEYDAKRSQAHYHYGGKVESIVSNEVLTSKIGYFHPDSKNFFFSKKVVYKGDELSMTTDTLRYLYSQNKTFFHGPTNITTEGAKMYCESGWYLIDNGDGSLVKNAWIKRDEDYISGDTLIYSPQNGYSIGKGNVYYKDSEQKMAFNSDYAFSSDSLNYSFLTGHALATKELATDTIYVHADTLFNSKIDTTILLKAYPNAALYSTTFQCLSDSISYSEQKGRIELHDNPIAWSKNAELNGDFIELIVTDSIIEKAIVDHAASIVMEVEDSLYYNQISGQLITAFFNDNDLFKANVNGNAITIFYPLDDEKTDSSLIRKRLGMNRIYASDLNIYIDSNEISGITYLEQPDGVFYPIDKIRKDEMYIPNFKWNIGFRPKNQFDLIKD